MSNVIKIKRRAAGGAVGAPAALKSGEPAWNNADNTLYIGAGDDGAGNATSVVPVGGSGAVVGLTNAQTISGAKSFTGTTTVPTVASADATTNAASTAFVKAQGYQTGNQNISVTGDATGSGTTGIVLTLKNTGTPGTYPKVTTDAQGRVTGGSALSSADVTTGLGFTPVNAASVGVANGIASLDAGGKVLTSQLPASITGAMNFQGTWNASTNTPAFASGVGTKGFLYKVSVAGNTTIDGISTWSVGDQIVFDGTVWDKIDGIASEVLTVAGRAGAVVLSAADIGGLSANATATVAAVANGGTGLSSAISGLVKGNAGAYSAAVVDTDYLSPASILDGGTF